MRVALSRIIAIIQLILHILGWLAIIGSVVAFLFGNTPRAFDLFISGLIFIGVKYVIGFIFVSLASHLGKTSTPKKEEFSKEERNRQLLLTLDAIYQGTAPLNRKKTIAISLVKEANLHEEDRVKLLKQIEKHFIKAKD